MDFLTRRNRSVAGRRRERGSAYVETLLALPVLVLLIFGLVDFSNVMREWLIANNTARAVAREASLSAGAQCNAGALENRAIQVGETLLAASNIPANRRQVRVGHTGAGLTLCRNGLLEARVNVTSPLTFLDRLNGNLPLLPIQLTASATVQNENVN